MNFLTCSLLLSPAWWGVVFPFIDNIEGSQVSAPDQSVESSESEVRSFIIDKAAALINKISLT